MLIPLKITSYKVRGYPVKLSVMDEKIKKGLPIDIGNEPGYRAVQALIRPFGAVVIWEEK